METNYQPRSSEDRRQTIPAQPPHDRGNLRVRPGRRHLDIVTQVLLDNMIGSQLDRPDLYAQDFQLVDWDSLQDVSISHDEAAKDAATTAEMEGAFGQDVDPTKIVPFSEYRELCDGLTDGFRHTGLVESANFDAACADEKTIFVETSDGIVPLLVDIEHEDGYDQTRSHELTRKDNVFLLTVPTQYLRDNPDRKIIYRRETAMADTAILVENYGQEDVPTFQDLFAAPGSLQQHEFFDPRVKDVEQRATMNLYELVVSPRKSSQDESDTPKNFDDAYVAYAASEDQAQTIEAGEETRFFSAEQLADSPEVVEGLWEISELGFGETLGKYHPVSMEGSKQFFESNLLAPNTYTAVRYHNGRPVCFGSLVRGVESCSWLNKESGTVQAAKQAADDNGEALLYFSEIISNGPKGASYSPDIIKLFLNLFDITQRDYRVLFESTNLSAQYIPMIVSRCVRDTENIEFKEPVRKIEELGYSYLSLKDQE